DIQIPMARSRVVTTLSSDLASTKIVNVGASIGTITGDHLTAVTGKLGAPPAMIPLDLTLLVSGAAPAKQKSLHFELVNHPKLTPLLVAITTFSGLTQNSLYGEGTTLHLSGEIRLQGHAAVQIENTFAPGDSLSPDGLPIALTMQNVFTRLFLNTFEPAKVARIVLRVESVPGRKSFAIESAWLEKGEAAPGETLRVRVLLRPYRGAARVEETTVRVPEQVARGTTLRILVCDADLLNRAARGTIQKISVADQDTQGGAARNLFRDANGGFFHTGGATIRPQQDANAKSLTGSGLAFFQPRAFNGERFSARDAFYAEH